jgi:YD repeat-containing protein
MYGWGHNESLLRQSLTLAQPNASDWTQTYGYDGSWRLQSVTSPAGSFGYNHQGASALVKGLTLPNTSYLTNLFDGAGRLLSTTLKTSSQSVLNAHTYQYNAAHQRTRQILTEGNYWDYGYDALGQLTSAKGKTPAAANRLHEQLSYGYDKAGNLTKRTNNALVQTFTLTNSLNQINGVNRSGTLRWQVW